MWPIPFIQPVFEYSVYQNRHFNSYDQWTNQTSALFSLLRGIHFKYFLGRITVYNCNLAFCIIILLFKYYNLTNSTQSPVCLPVPLRVTAHSLDVASRGCFTLCKCQTEMPTSIKGDVRPPGMWLIRVMSIWNRISKRNFLQELGFWLSLTWYPLVCSVCLHSCAAAAGQYSLYILLLLYQCEYSIFTLICVARCQQRAGRTGSLTFGSFLHQRNGIL